MSHILRSIVFASLSLICVLPTSAKAEQKVWANPQSGEKSPQRPQAEASDWSFEVGGGAMVGTAYEGSDKYVFMPVPNLSVEYKNGLFFVGGMGGIGSFPLQGENYKVGASVGLAFGRDEDDDKDNLRGMGDIDQAVAFNLMGEYDFGPVKLSGKVTKGTDDYGTTATLELGTMIPVAEQVMLMGSVESTWADSDHMMRYFGVSTTQSARSGYRRFKAESGIKSVGFAVGAIYNITEHWGANLMVKGDQLLGDAADSPITKQDFQPMAFLAVSYKF